MAGSGQSVLGVDGWRGGWIGAEVSGREIRWRLLDADPASWLSTPMAAIGIDLPIGLPEPGPDFRRAADLQARSFLAPWRAQNSVFFTPVRPVLSARSYEQANLRSRELTGTGLSKQSWHITDRIARLDDALGDPPAPTVIEVHPEVSFRLLDRSINTPKRTARGVGQRISALSRELDLADALSDVPAGPGLDDCLDACVVAWSARRWLTGSAITLGATLDSHLLRDARDRPMRIVG